jgi:Proteasome maturation factor UMP1
MDASTPKIPIYTKQDNALEADVNTGNYAVAVAERHPIDVLQQRTRSNVIATTTVNPYQDLNFVRSIYGSGLAMEMAAERQYVQKERNMGMHKIGNIYEDIVLGNDVTMQYTDFMSLPDHRIELPKSVFHISMDRQLKKL